MALHVLATPASIGPAEDDVATVLLVRGVAAAEEGACVSSDPAVWDAYAAIGGVTAGGLAGTQFLADPHGWLRAVQPAGSPRWSDPALLRADVSAVRRDPLTAPAAGHVHH